MHTAELLIAELKVKSSPLVKKYIDAFRDAQKNDPSNPLKNYYETVGKTFSHEQAAIAMGIAHKSIIEGVDDQVKLIIGMQEIGRDHAEEIKQGVAAILNG